LLAAKTASSAHLEGDELLQRVVDVRLPLQLVANAGGAIGISARPAFGEHEATTPCGLLPPLFPEWLGDRRFLDVYGTRFPYIVGEMARGIASEEMVIAAARHDIFAFFGSAGLGLERIDRAVAQLTATLDPARHPWGINLIHSPADPALEAALVDRYIAGGVRVVSASAFMGLTKNVVRYAARGLRRAPDGSIMRAHRLLAKVSRPEVARAFLLPPPHEMLAALVADGRLTADEAALATRIPVAEDITAEADSGGHTDNRPLVALIPTLLALRDELLPQFEERVAIRIGAAGGLGTPNALAAAFAAGASYVLTGSVNQAARESGLAPGARAMLSEVELADTAMAACADMFELGVKVQVLRRGTMFPMRANRLYELYRSHDSLEAIPAATRAQIERTIFRASLDDVWASTRAHFAELDPAELERADREPRHRMALVFRWYLGLSSRWPLLDDPERRADYQIWCGPAMAAFNAWVKGTFLAQPDRGVVEIALNLLEGAAIATRAQQLRSFGVDVPGIAFNYPPRRLSATA
jgi:trans-AT polyketide synthase, acyltransferase and oxidoreductase domains